MAGFSFDGVRLQLNLPAMKPPTERQKFAALCILAILLVIALCVFVRAAAEQQLTAFLTEHGVGQTIVMSNGDFSGGSIVLSDVKLDPAGDSTIGDVRARIRWPFLWSSRPFSQIVIDHLILVGSVDESGHLTISGVKLGPLAPLVEADEIQLNSGRLDVTTPAGDLQFLMKGHAVRQPDGSFKIDAAFWGSQYQMTLDTRWQGTVNNDGTWTAAADVREMKGNISHIVWSRASGWLKIDGNRLGTQAISGQLQAGQFRIGTQTVLSDATLTMDGPLLDWHRFLKGTLSSRPGMALVAEEETTPQSQTVHVDVSGKSADDLTGFLASLRDDFRLALPRSSLLTTLLLTPGNLNRVHDEAQRVKYTSADLLIDGAASGFQSHVVLHGPAGAGDSTIDLQPLH